MRSKTCRHSGKKMSLDRSEIEVGRMTLDKAKEILEEIKLNDDCLTQYVAGFDEALDMAIKALKQNPCSNCIEFKRYAKEMGFNIEQEPCENCCNGNQIEKAKLCQKSYLAGMEHKQEPCEDAVSRKNVWSMITGGKYPNENDEKFIDRLVEGLEKMPPVTPQPKTGHWIYDSYNWRCSECNETPKTMGYVGTADFMTKHFKFCNHCGAKMESEG